MIIFGLKSSITFTVEGMDSVYLGGIVCDKPGNLIAMKSGEGAMMQITLRTTDDHYVNFLAEELSYVMEAD